MSSASVRSSFRRKPKPIYNLPKEQERERKGEQERSQAPIIPLRHSLSGIDSEKEVHISQCSLEYEAEKEVHYPAKSVVARVLSPEPPYEERDEESRGEEMSAESKTKQHHCNDTTAKAASPTPSYRTRDSSQDPEVVHTPSLILPIEEEPEEMIAGQEEDSYAGTAGDDDGGSSSGAGSEEEEEAETADEEEEDILFLPLQDFDGRDIVPQDARLRRPPSWDFGVPLLPLGAHASVVSTAGEAAFSDPVSPMSPQHEKNPFSFRDTLSMRPLPPPPPQVKRNSWNNPDYEGAGWI